MSADSMPDGVAEVHFDIQIPVQRTKRNEMSPIK
jgi:hypothetical protein